MIGQHIYSRCLEGYFSRSAVNADSTTVTISSRMFAREEQARKVADQCAGISTLEDVRPVPVQTQGPYRGVLKIRRLNHQITVVCRSYRLHADQPQTGGFSGSGEFRDFTFASSYILTGEDKERFLAHPEYFLNIQDFESYSSVMKRIEESRMLGRNGRIEANEEYSLFRSSCREATPRVFVQAGFTRELFVNYISSLIQRISYSHYSGHERDKVLVILPSRFNPAWEKSGGNGYAEQVLAATMKLLPRCVCGQLNANTGGMNEPDASVLRGYQLVFMEIGPTGDWRRSEYSVIDLNRQESMVTEGLNTDYAEFLWEHRMDEDARNYFEEQYEALFGPENTAEGDNSPEKFALVLALLSEEKADFADGRKRERLLADFLNYCGSAWTKRGTALAVRALQAETRDPGCGKILEKEILSLLESGDCPDSIREAAAAVLMQMILHGDAQERSIHWICRGIREKDSVITDIVQDANRRIDADSETTWHERRTLLDFYCNICRDPEIHGDHPVKREILSILSAWCIKLLDRNDWENSARVTEILAEQLGDLSLPAKGRREIYRDLLYILFYGEGEGREKISEILKGEERALPSSPGNLEIFWECFLSQTRSGEAALNLNKDVLWHLTYLAISREEEFLKNQWEPLYREIVQRSDVKCVPEMTGRVRENFIGWAGSVRDKKAHAGLSRYCHDGSRQYAVWGFRLRPRYGELPGGPSDIDRGGAAAGCWPAFVYPLSGRIRSGEPGKLFHTGPECDGEMAFTADLSF